LNAESKASLSKFAASLNANPQTNVQIFGHTDNTGTDNINIPLSQQRAAAVQNYIISQGVSANRLNWTGKGSSEPVADNSTTAGKAQNRRVEIYILANAQMIQDAHQGQ
jgi:outer membrane protein OmpA-like peptidoglycan-associated protein